MNLFRQAKNLLDTKDGREWTEEEWEVFGAAMIPLTILAKYNDMTTKEGLEDLARMVEENKDAEETKPRRHPRRFPWLKSQVP